MYRIELAPGEITVFRTIEELATGVRNGVITPRARIFHGASQKWLPIEFHPHHKLALELLAGRTIDLPTQKSTDGLNFDNIVTPMVASAPSAPAANLPYIDLDEPVEAEAPAVPAAPVRAAPPRVAPTSVAPIQAAPVQPLPVQPTTVQAAPVQAATVHAAPIQAAPVHEAPARQAPVQASPVLAPWARAAPVPAAPAPVAVMDVGPAAVPPVDVPPAQTEGAQVSRAPAAPFQIRPAPFAPSPFAPPAAVASPVLDLPRIEYPEVTPELMPAEKPVGDGPPAAPRRVRPLYLAGVVLVLAIGAYAARAMFSAPRSERPATEAAAVPAPAPAPTVAERPTLPSADSASSASSAGASLPSSVTPAAAPASAHLSPPAESVPPRAPVAVWGATAPASSGFAPALEARANVPEPAPKPANQAPVDSVAAIAAPQMDVNLSVPALAGAESLMAQPHGRGDSAMKRILKAVGGGKEQLVQP